MLALGKEPQANLTQVHSNIRKKNIKGKNSLGWWKKNEVEETEELIEYRLTNLAKEKLAPNDG